MLYVLLSNISIASLFKAYLHIAMHNNTTQYILYNCTWYR